MIHKKTGMDEADRRALAMVLRVGLVEVTAYGRRNGMAVDTAPARRLLTELGRVRPQTGPAGDPWVTIGAVEGTSARSLRRWAASGRIRAKRVGRTWLVHREDVRREAAR